MNWFHADSYSFARNRPGLMTSTRSRSSTRCRYDSYRGAHVTYWHLATIPAAHAFGRYGATTDIGRHWLWMTRSRMTQSERWRAPGMARTLLSIAFGAIVRGAEHLAVR